MNSRLLLPRRNQKVMTRLARIVGKYRYYRFLGMSRIESLTMAVRVTK